jgi:DNA-binding NtrC family response regulator
MTDQPDKSIRILLVDDEEDLVTFLSQRLLKRSFTVMATTSGSAAIAAVQQQTFDVAIVDLKMPQMDGIEVLRQLRQEQPFLQVIMLTGHGSHDSALEAGKLDAFRYVVKPYDFDDLLGLIREAHDQKRQEQQASFKEELQKVIEGGGSPRDIARATERLRQEYEQN